MQAITLAKTCEPTTEMRECRSPRDWSLLALQNIRTGKSHYLVICRCPDSYNLGRFIQKTQIFREKKIRFQYSNDNFHTFQRVQWRMINQHTPVFPVFEYSA